MKIALLGSAPHSVNLAPFKDQSWSASRQGMPNSPFRLEPYVDQTWEIWGVSPGAFAHVQRASRWFEVHRWEPGQPWFGPEYVQFLRDFRGPVYTGGPIPEIRNHVVYPIERVERVFSAYFLHSSLSLMAALAILEIEDARKERGGPDPDGEVIGFWGVDMAANEEYGDQRSGCHFFILEALRRGISVFVPPESCLLRPKPIYGLSEWSHDYIKMTAKQRDWNMRRQHYSAQLEDAKSNLQQLTGASAELDYMVNTWTSPYGLPAGLNIRMTDGDLGGGITLPRPVGEFIANYDEAVGQGPAPGLIPITAERICESLGLHPSSTASADNEALARNQAKKRAKAKARRR